MKYFFGTSLGLHIYTDSIFGTKKINLIFLVLNLDKKIPSFASAKNGTGYVPFWKSGRDPSSLYTGKIRKPVGDANGTLSVPSYAIRPFCLTGSLCLIGTSPYHIKASVKLVTFGREKQIIPWQGVYFFTNTVLQ